MRIPPTAKAIQMYRSRLNLINVISRYSDWQRFEEVVGRNGIAWVAARAIHIDAEMSFAIGGFRQNRFDEKADVGRVDTTKVID